MYKKQLFIPHAVLVVGLVAPGGMAFGDENEQVTWNQPGVGLWSDEANWTPGIPEAGDDVVIDGGPAQLTGEGAAGQLTLGMSAAGILEVLAGGQLTLDGGTWDEDEGGPGPLQVGQGAQGTLTIADGQVSHTTGGINVGSAAAHGVMHVSGSSAAVVAADALSVGGSGTGELTIVGGTVDLGSNNLLVGNDVGGTGSFSFEGGTLNAGEFRVGMEGTGTATISGGALNLGSRIQVGIHGTGELSIDGGDHQIGSRIQVGRAGGDGTFHYSGGTLVTTSSVYVGEEGTGVATVSGGELTIASTLRIGADGVGDFSVEDGQINLGGRIRMADGNGTATYTQTGGVVNVSGSPMRMSDNGSGTSTTIISGGQLNITSSIQMAHETGATADFALEGDGAVSLTSNFDIARSGGMGSFTQTGGTMYVDGRLRMLTDSSSGSANVTISGEGTSFTARSAIQMGGGGAEDVLFHVAGSGAEITTGRWIHESQATLRVGLDHDGISLINVVADDDYPGDVTFAAGALLDPYAIDDVFGTWTIMEWEGILADDGLALAPGVDMTEWSFSFDGNTLQVTRVPEPTMGSLLCVGIGALLLRRRSRQA